MLTSSNSDKQMLPNVEVISNENVLVRKDSESRREVRRKKTKKEKKNAVS